MNKVTNKIDKLNAEDVKKSLKELLQDYLTLAFGSISKRDFDILLFYKITRVRDFQKKP